MARLKDRYNDQIRTALVRKFGYSSVMQAPKLEKVTLNMGVGEAKQDSKMLDAAQEQLATIAGQKPNIRRARKSVAAFKLREGMPVGLSVTLRDERAYEFLDRLTSIALPRLRDFRGLNPRSFDGRGNYSMGIREQVIFPEIDYDSDRPGPRARRHHHHIRRHRSRGVRAARRAGHALRPRRAPGRLRDPRPGARGGLGTQEIHGQEVQDRAPVAHTEIQDAGPLALPPLRPPACRVPQVRPLPDLPARARAQRLHPRHDEVELVIACR